MERIRDVVVVGAGPAGSVAAADLALRGWDVLLLERDRFPRHKVCGEFLSPELQSSLTRLGLRESDCTPAQLTHAAVCSAGGRVVELPLPEPAWGLSRYTLDHTLLQLASRRGADTQLGVAVTAFTPDPKRGPGAFVVSARAPDGRVERIDTHTLLVAAGFRSGAGAKLRGADPDIAWKCHYERVDMPPRVELYLFRGGYVGLNPVEKGRVNVCLLASYETFRRAGRSMTDLLAALGRANLAFGARLRGAHRLVETEKAAAPYRLGLPPLPWNRTAHLGDAAAMLPPLCGDGLAMAVRSAELVAPLVHGFLRGELSWTDWASAYSRAWHEEFDRRLRVGGLLHRVFGMPPLSELLFAAAGMVPAIGRYFVQATRGPAPGSRCEGTPNA